MARSMEKNMVAAMEKNKIKLVIFDLDGVLVDAREMHYDALNRALAELDPKYLIGREEHLSTFDGRPTSKKLALLSQTKGLPKSSHNLVWKKKQEHTIKIITEEFAYDERLRVVLSRLKEDGLKICVCSNSIRESTKMMLLKKGLMEFFSCMASSPVRLAAKIAGITPDCEQGISHLEDAVTGGGYSRIEAGNALTYIYMYFLNKPEEALQHINPLSDEHPQNPFFAALKGEGLALTSKWIELEKFYPHLEALSTKGPFLQQNETQLKLTYIRALQAFSRNNLQTSVDYTTWIIENYHMEFDWLLGKAYLLRGKCYDLLNNREKAIGDYKRTIKLDNYFPDGDIARGLIKKSYSKNDHN